MRRPFLFTLATLCALAGCRGKQRTMLVVEVDSNLAVPGEMDKVDIAVTANGKTQHMLYPLVGGYDLPLYTVLVETSDITGTIDIVATGLLNSVSVVSEEAIVGFVEGQSRLLKLFLVAECRGDLCANSNQTCTTGGACVDKVRTPSNLPVYNTSDLVKPADAGPAKIGDAAPAGDAAGDTWKSETGADAAGGYAGVSGTGGAGRTGGQTGAGGTGGAGAFGGTGGVGGTGGRLVGTGGSAGTVVSGGTGGIASSGGTVVGGDSGGAAGGGGVGAMGGGVGGTAGGAGGRMSVDASVDGSTGSGGGGDSGMPDAPGAQPDVQIGGSGGGFGTGGSAGAGSGGNSGTGGTGQATGGTSSTGGSCPGTMCGSTCSDLATDVNNCGACGRSCQNTNVQGLSCHAGLPVA